MLCSGIHSEFSHRVKGITMTNWKDADVVAIKAGGNELARSTWLAEWPKGKKLPTERKDIKNHINDVYINKKYFKATVRKTKKKKSTQPAATTSAPTATPTMSVPIAQNPVATPQPTVGNLLDFGMPSTTTNNTAPSPAPTQLLPDFLSDFTAPPVTNTQQPPGQLMGGFGSPTMFSSVTPAPPHNTPVAIGAQFPASFGNLSTSPNVQGTQGVPGQTPPTNVHPANDPFGLGIGTTAPMQMPQARGIVVNTPHNTPSTGNTPSGGSLDFSWLGNYKEDPTARDRIIAKKLQQEEEKRAKEEEQKRKAAEEKKRRRLARKQAKAASKTQVDDDMALAMKLQQEEYERERRRRGGGRSQQEISDAELARRLQAQFQLGDN